MKSGLFLDSDGSNLYMSPGQLTINGLTRSTSSKLTVPYPTTPLTRKTIYYVYVASGVSGTFGAAQIGFSTTVPTQQSDGYLYVQFGPTYKRVIGAFMTPDADRFPYFGQNGSDFWYNELLRFNVSGNIYGYGFFGDITPGSNNPSTTTIDFSSILPDFAETVDSLWTIRPDPFLGTNEATAWIYGIGGTGNGFKVFQIDNMDETNQNNESQSQEIGPLRLTLNDQALDFELEKPGGDFDSEDEFTVSGRIHGWPLPWNIAESQV